MRTEEFTRKEQSRNTNLTITPERLTLKVGVGDDFDLMVTRARRIATMIPADTKRFAGGMKRNGWVTLYSAGKQEAWTFYVGEEN